MIWLDAISVLIVSVSLTPVLRRALVKRSILDIPNDRSSHSRPVPRGGGLSIVLTTLSAVLFLALSRAIPGNVAVAILVGGVLIAGVGFMDDVSPLPVWVRAAAHSIAAGWGIWCLGGMAPLHLGRSVWQWGWLGHAAGLIGLVWMINLYNFMDGIDGLAGAEAVFAGAAGALLLATAGQFDLARVALLLSCSSAGFLVWNWPPAKVFLGDAGSGFLGLLLGILALASARRQPPLLWTWLILLGIFVLDASFTLVRRVLRGERWCTAHRSHAYQRAAQAARSHAKVTLRVAVLNVFWLCPLAWCAGAIPVLAPLFSQASLSFPWSAWPFISMPALPRRLDPAYGPA